MLAIINYHYIRPNFSSKFPSIFGVTPQEFEDQLRNLRERGKFIHPKELLKKLSWVLEQEEVFYLLTFDDGLKEQVRYALPVLDKLQVPAIFFPNSLNHKQKKMSTVHKVHLLRSTMSAKEMMKQLGFDNLELNEEERQRAINTYCYDDEKSALLKYFLNFKFGFEQQEKAISPIFSSLFQEDEEVEELYMSGNEIIELANRGYLGSHTHNHYPLGLLGSSAIESELEISKNFFEELTGERISYVSYPYGTDEACTPEVALKARKVGYEIGITTKRGMNKNGSEALMLKRFDCNDLSRGELN